MFMRMEGGGDDMLAVGVISWLAEYSHHLLFRQVDYFRSCFCDIEVGPFKQSQAETRDHDRLHGPNSSMACRSLSTVCLTASKKNR